MVTYVGFRAWGLVFRGSGERVRGQGLGKGYGCRVLH
jgi:hypothetical protein